MEAEDIAELVRESSRNEILLASADIEAAIAGRDIPVSDPSTGPVQVPALIMEAVRGNDDLKVILDDSGGPWYFSERFMTGAYARVLLLKGQGPLKMMAEVIREHSRVYPRPVPLSLFQCPPFNLSEDEIALCLKEMADKPPYRDIAHLTTSIGSVFAYSTDHIEPGHAAMLAEWVDVGQAANP